MIHYIDINKTSVSYNKFTVTVNMLVVNLGRPTVCTRLVTFVPVVFPCCLLIFICSKPASIPCRCPVPELRIGSIPRRSSRLTCRIVSTC